MPRHYHSQSDAAAAAAAHAAAAARSSAEAAAAVAAKKKPGSLSIDIDDAGGSSSPAGSSDDSAGSISSWTYSTGDSSGLFRLVYKFLKTCKYTIFVFEILVTLVLGIPPIFSSKSLIQSNNTSQAPLIIFFLCYGGSCVGSSVVFALCILRRCKRDKGLHIYFARYLLLLLLAGLLFFIWFILPHTYYIDICAGILVFLLLLGHVTAWDCVLPCDSEEVLTGMGILQM